jgi:hypothetical protein
MKISKNGIWYEVKVVNGELKEVPIATHPWQKYLTPEEHASLTPQGIMMADYWTEWLPKMCKKMKRAGTLYPTLKSEGERLAELMTELMQVHKYPMDGALEIIKEEVYALPPEE